MIRMLISAAVAMGVLAGAACADDTVATDSTQHAVGQVRFTTRVSFSLARVADIGAHGGVLDAGISFKRHYWGVMGVYDTRTPKTDDDLDMRGAMLRYRFDVLAAEELVAFYLGASAGYLETEIGTAVAAYTIGGDYIGKIIEEEPTEIYGGVGLGFRFGYKPVFLGVEYSFLIGKDYYGHLFNIGLELRLPR